VIAISHVVPLDLANDAALAVSRRGRQSGRRFADA